MIDTSGVFYLDELDTYTGKYKSIYLKPSFIKTTVAPAPSRIKLVSYVMNMWFDKPPTKDTYKDMKMFISPYKPIPTMSYSSRLRLTSTPDEISTEIRKHFKELVVGEGRMLSEENGKDMIKEKNTFTYTHRIDENYNVIISNPMLTQLYDSDITNGYKAPKYEMTITRSLVFMEKVIYEDTIDIPIPGTMFDKRFIAFLIEDISNKKVAFQDLHKYCTFV